MSKNEIQNRKRRSLIGRWIAFFLTLSFIGGYGLLTLRKNVSSAKPVEVEDYKAWEEEVIDASRDIAIQDGGRVKPFSTWAGFTMLNMHGARSMKISIHGKKQKLGPEDVVLDCLFRPEMAKNLPLFRIDNSDVITSLGAGDLSDELKHASGIDDLRLKEAIEKINKTKDRRDRYSLNELGDIYPVLLAKAQLILDKKANKEEMSVDQRQSVDLAQKIWLFLRLTYHMDFARADVTLRETAKESQKEEMKRMSFWIRAFPLLADTVRKMREAEGGEGGIPREMPEHLRQLLGDIEVRMLRSSEKIGLLPPYQINQEEWIPIGKRIEKVVSGDRRNAEELLNDIVMLEDVCIALDSHGQSSFRKALLGWKKSVHSRLEDGQTQKLSSEVFYNQMNYFFRALVIFIVAFVLVMFGWLAPRTLGARICNWLALGLGVAALTLMITGIVHRCIIMDRSPIGNLYDTILFIGTTGVFVLLLVEFLTRRNVALGLSVFMGMSCMFLARRYEIGDASDHMDPLVAVLKSNFWLSTHVVTVTIGYMGGLAAAGLSAIYLFARVLGIDEGDKNFRRAMTRNAYGMVCFTLFFSLIGTVLGGIWANDSWGRFWGWDPKENGALMIVLWCLAVLHARLAGYLKEWGVHIAGVFGANIIAFSWWHVNSLSTGLHSYGFIDGLGVIWGFYALMTGICLMGLIAARVTQVQK